MFSPSTETMASVNLPMIWRFLILAEHVLDYANLNERHQHTASLDVDTYAMVPNTQQNRKIQFQRQRP